MNMHVGSELAQELHRQAVERRKRMALAAVKNQPRPTTVQITRDNGVVLRMTREEAERRRQAEIEHREVTLAAREAAMNEALGLYAMGAPKRPTARQILSEVSQKRGIPVADIVGPWRRQDLVEARHEAAYRMRTETMMSFPLIGRAIGGRDHTTVLHGYRRHAARLAALAAE